MLNCCWFYITHPSVVNGFYGSFFGLDAIGICPRKSDSIGAERLQLCHDLFIGQPAVYHGHQVDGCIIGDPSPVYIVGFDAQLCPDLCGDLPAAMYQDLCRVYF